jgi:hypothetical protein
MDAARPRPALPLAFDACESFRGFAVNGRRGQEPHSTEQRDYQLVLTPSEVGQSVSMLNRRGRNPIDSRWLTSGVGSDAPNSGTICTRLRVIIR